jgi:hypothetical protein
MRTRSVAVLRSVALMMTALAVRLGIVPARRVPWSMLRVTRLARAMRALFAVSLALAVSWTLALRLRSVSAWRVPLGMLRMTRLVRRLRSRLTVRLLLAVRFARPVGLAIAMRLAVTVRLPLAMGLALSLRSCAPCRPLLVHVLTRGGIYRLHFARTRGPIARRNSLPCKLLDIAQQPAFLAIAERNRNPVGSGARRAPNAMHVRLRHIRQIVVDHM